MDSLFTVLIEYSFGILGAVVLKIVLYRNENIIDILKQNTYKCLAIGIIFVSFCTFIILKVLN